MGNNFLKNKKGQISIEFILIILIALIYIHGVVQPTISISTQSTEDVTRLSQAKLAAQKLATAINQLEANQSEGKKTTSLFIPEGTSIECDAANEKITFSAAMSQLRKPPQCTAPCEYGCQDRQCSGFIKLIPGTALSCPILAADQGAGNFFREILVEKPATGPIVVSYAP